MSGATSPISGNPYGAPTRTERSEVKCVLCGEPMMPKDRDGNEWMHLFTGKAECTYRAHL